MSRYLVGQQSLGQKLFPTTGLYNVILVVGSALLIAMLAQLKFYMPGNPVPITAQTVGVLLVAGFFGRYRAVSAVMLYVVLGAAGLPFFAVGNALTAGYLIGFVFAAFCVGFLAEQGFDRSFMKALPAFLLGFFIIYACGVTGLSASIGLAKALYLGFYTFLPVIFVKTVMLAIIFPVAWRCHSLFSKR